MATETETPKASSTPAPAAPSVAAPAAATTSAPRKDMAALVKELDAQFANQKPDPAVAPSPAPAPATGAAPVDAPKPAPAEAPPEGKLSKNWAAVREDVAKVKRDREALAAREAAFKREQEAFKAQAETASKSNTNFQQAFRENPFGVMKAMGVDFAALVKAAAEGKAPELAPKANDEVTKLREELNQFKADAAAREQQARLTDIRATYEREVTATLDTPDFSLLKSHPRAKDEVLDLATRWARTYNEALTPAEAAAKVQEVYREYLRAQYSHEAVRKTLGLDGAAPTTAAPKAPAPAAPSTLSNDLTAVAPPVPNANGPKLTDRQRLEAAAKMLPDDFWG